MSMKRIYFVIILLLGFVQSHAYTKTNISIYVDGVQRNMIVFTPDGVSSGLPLMIVTHGMNQNPTYQYEGDHLWELIDTERFIIAYLASNGSTWDIGGNGDLNFVDATIDKMDELYHIDRNRLYWSGFSMGSMLIYHGIRSEIGKKFAAFAPCSGVLFNADPWNQRTTPVNLIHCHSYDDDVFDYNQYSIREYVTHFATLDNANTYTKTENYRPNASELGYIYGDKEVWTNGSNGSEVELFSAHGGGHWPTLAYKYEIWNFCKRFSLNGRNPGETKVSASYELGDDIAIYAPADWAGQTNGYGGLGHTAYERYNSGSIGTGDVLTQTLTGLKNGVYVVTLELAASFTSDRGFDCPTGDGLSVAFANGTQENLPVVNRGWVSSIAPVTLYAVVTDGTLKYGIRNLKDSGNWYVANVTSIVYESESTTLTHKLTVTTAGVSTLYLPYDAVIPDADFFVAATVKEISGSTALLKEIRGGIIPAKTGVLIFANAGNYTFSLSATSSTEHVVSLLRGVSEETPVQTLTQQEGMPIYVLSRGTNEYIGFKKATGSSTVKTIPAYKAYLPFDDAGESKFVSFSFGGDDALGIDMLKNPQETSGDIYDLTGRKVTAPKQGIYIVNGKKTMYK